MPTAQSLREQDLAMRLQQAEQRRASDQALRQIPTRCRLIADDTALLQKRGSAPTDAAFPTRKPRT